MPSRMAAIRERFEALESRAEAAHRRLPRPLRDGVTIVRRAIKQFTEDKAVVLAGALSFYTSLSLAPLVILLLWIVGAAGRDWQQSMIDEVRQLIGPEGSRVVEIVVENAASTPALSTIAGWVSIATLVFGATIAFAQLQTAMNIIWDVRVKPGRGLHGFIRKRLLSVGMFVTLGFLLLVSLAISASISFVSTHLGEVLPGGLFWRGLNLAGNLLVFTLLFALAFRYLPDARIPWRYVWFGALVTALLFGAGKYLIGLYLGNSSVGSAYGAAGSLVVLLVWVYFSTIIVFFGAEITQARAALHGRRVVPAPYAEVTDCPKEHSATWGTDGGGRRGTRTADSNRLP